MEKLTEKMMPSKDVPHTKPVPAQPKPVPVIKKKKIEEVPEEPKAEEEAAPAEGNGEADGNAESA